MAWALSQACKGLGKDNILVQGMAHNRRNQTPIKIHCKGYEIRDLILSQTLRPAPNPRNTGRGRLAPYQDFLIELVQQDPDITLKELQKALADAQGVVASLSGIDQALKRLGYTYKKRASLRMNASAQG